MTHSADFLRAVHHNLCDMAGEMVRADMRLARGGEREPVAELCHSIRYGTFVAPGMKLEPISATREGVLTDTLSFESSGKAG
jgi:hypothetical protein